MSRIDDKSVSKTTNKLLADQYKDSIELFNIKTNKKIENYKAMLNDLDDTMENTSMNNIL